MCGCSPAQRQWDRGGHFYRRKALQQAPTLAAISTAAFPSVFYGFLTVNCCPGFQLSRAGEVVDTFLEHRNFGSASALLPGHREDRKT